MCANEGIDRGVEENDSDQSLHDGIRGGERLAIIAERVVAIDGDPGGRVERAGDDAELGERAAIAEQRSADKSSLHFTQRRHRLPPESTVRSQPRPAVRRAPAGRYPIRSASAWRR